MLPSGLKLRRLLGHCLAWLLMLLAGCGTSEPVLTMQALYDEERNLPAVYLVDNTNEQVVLPGERGVLVHQGKLCWRAQTCTNPACPAKSASNEPYLFSAANPAIVLQADGTIGHDPTQAKGGDDFDSCPQCLALRNLATESDQDRQRYANYVRPFVLPDTAQRRQELAAARAAREQHLRTRMASGE